MEFQCKKFEE